MSSRRQDPVSRAAETASKTRLHMDRNPQSSRITDPSNPAGRRKEIDNVMKRARQGSPGTWDRKLLEVEEKDPNRWRHTGYKQMYLDGSSSPSPSRRSRTPVPRRSRSPGARRSRSPLARRSRSPGARRSRSPGAKRSKSSVGRRSRSPFGRRSPAGRRSPRRSPRRQSPRRKSITRSPGRRRSPRPRSPPPKFAGLPRSRVSPVRVRVASPPRPRPGVRRPPSPPPQSSSGSSDSSCSNESCSVCSPKNKKRPPGKPRSKSSSPPPRPVKKVLPPKPPKPLTKPLNSGNAAAKPSSLALQPTRELLKARESSKRSREEKVLEWQRTQLGVSRPPPPGATIPPRRIKREGERDKPVPPPRVSPTTIAAALTEGEERARSDEEPPRLTLSERFGKMAQWSADRSARLQNMKITRRSAGLTVLIQDDDPATDDRLDDYAGLDPAPVGSYPEELLAVAPGDLPSWDDVRVRYDYYKKRGYLRGLTLADYVKWEEWWYKYQEWLKRERAYERWADVEVRRERKRRRETSAAKLRARRARRGPERGPRGGRAADVDPGNTGLQQNKKLQKEMFVL